MMEWKTLIEHIEQENPEKAVQTLEKTCEKLKESLLNFAVVREKGHY
jgi:hypothetical protein